MSSKSVFFCVTPKLGRYDVFLQYKMGLIVEPLKDALTS